MAKRKPTKEEAKRRIDELPIIPKLGLPIGGPTLGELAKAFVDVDPLGRTAPSQDAVIEAMVNEPTFKLSPDQVDLINNDSRMVAQVNGEMVEIPSSVVRRGVIGPGQFDRSRIMPKRTRKKTKTDKIMSKALRQANERLRKTNGQLRKGITQADVMRLAHRLRRKMS